MDDQPPPRRTPSVGASGKEGTTTVSHRRLEIQLQPKVLRWARERAGLPREILAAKIGVKPERVERWETTGEISIAQVDKLAHHTRTPLGYLYLPEPVEETLPIPDLRTVGDRPPARPSPELLDTIRMMQLRQAWLRDELIERGEDPIPFVGSAQGRPPVEEIAQLIRDSLGLSDAWANAHPSWADALRDLRRRIEAAGVTVVINGVVGNNTHRKLDVSEFRGFALVDEYAPLIFVNGADFTSAQMFTLVHELAHIWIGQGGVSNFDRMQPAPLEVERYCNAVAAEVLVPRAELMEYWATAQGTADPFGAVARRFKVSTIVAARRALDLDLVTRDRFFEFYRTWEQHEHRQKQRPSGGGDFWKTQSVRIGHRFGVAVVRAVLENRLFYRDAYMLTGLRGKTFDKFVEQMEAEL